MLYSRLSLHGKKKGIWAMKIYSGRAVKIKTIKSISLQSYQKITIMLYGV